MANQTAQLNYLRIAPRKVRLVAETIRGASVNDAEAILLSQSRRPAKPILKLLRSAVQNAKHNQKLEPGKLFVSGIRVDRGPMLKRMLPRARGMATPIQRVMSHVTLTLSENKKLTPRFAITVKKKVKLPSDRGKSKHEKPGEVREARSTPMREAQPGFFRRIFRRKAEGGGR